ncbi:MAG TPA: hypothetical protein VJ836_06695 [Candidatus Saccharimonadales bacterium]|nr:hypothetical protein [Candidatus Saccharimonadales bacterium]
MKKLLIAMLAFGAFLVGYGTVADAYPNGGMYGRGEFRGYFTNDYDDVGTHVLPNVYDGDAIPDDVNSAAEFIHFMKNTKLDMDGNGSGDTQERTGAAFIIQTMIGSSRDRTPSAAQIAEWEQRVNAYAAAGRIQWSTNFNYTINSLYQGPRGGGALNDDAFFDERGNGSSIIFNNPNGTRYVIRRHCANPVGDVSPLQDISNFNMTGRTTVTDTTVIPGQDITFRHYVRNTGPNATNPTTIRWRTYNTLSGAMLASGPPGASYYADDQEKFVNEEDFRVPAGAVPGTRYCRHVWWSPDTQAGGSQIGTSVCATVIHNYTLTPSINVLVNGAAPPANSVVEVGDRVDFVYAVNNDGPTVSQPTSCTIYGLTRPSYYAVPSPHDSTSDPGYSQPPHGCPRIFPLENTTLGPPETILSIPATSLNRTICRSIFITPRSASGGTASDESCVRVGAKPYLRVFGGDVSAGNGQSTAPGVCVNNNSAAVVSWNRGTPGYTGAGAQYAVLALGRINGFATSHGNTPVGPNRLAFANTGGISGLDFGGSLGSQPCIPDYYSRMPAGAAPFGGNISAMGGGSFRASGPLALAAGNINPGQRSVLYVNGDVLITGPITYPGGWNTNTMPSFTLVVRGNIYVSRTVSRLDGVFIAQPNGASGGTIYTCANPDLPATAVLTTGGAVFSSCSAGLEINGAFVAKQVQFLRTRGTLTADPALNTSIAEIFNFSPALWMAQPPVPAGAGTDYDAIISLPPVL